MVEHGMTIQKLWFSAIGISPGKQVFLRWRLLQNEGVSVCV